MSDDDGLSVFSRLRIERERTLFMMYGVRTKDGQTVSGYFKLAHSLSEALADLDYNENVAVPVEGYAVRDLFLEDGEDGVVVHVELRPGLELLDGDEEDES